MAPERISGRPQGPPSDVWSLGATLRAARAGHSPSSHHMTLATLHAALYEEPELPPAPGPLRAWPPSWRRSRRCAPASPTWSRPRPVAFPAPEAPGPRDPRRPGSPPRPHSPRDPRPHRPPHDPDGRRGSRGPGGGRSRRDRARAAPRIRRRRRPGGLLAPAVRHRPDPGPAQRVPHRRGQGGKSYRITTWCAAEPETTAPRTYGTVKDSFTVLRRRDMEEGTCERRPLLPDYGTTGLRDYGTDGTAPGLLDGVLQDGVLPAVTLPLPLHHLLHEGDHEDDGRDEQ
ncbi:hypothetical protein [Streptomyces sp. NPDC014995]|uniref:hypothetical protein n=1 Tax=Streptomyces sp. NPDC014995 TaxID=3364936 RepID=UPI0036FC2E23